MSSSVSTSTSRRPPPEAAGFDRPLLLTPRQDLLDRAGRLIGRGILTLLACAFLLGLLAVVAFILKEAWGLLSQGVYLRQFFTSDGWRPTDEPQSFGALGLIVGSSLVAGGAMVIAAPVGLLTAVFLSDIAPVSVRRIAKPVIDILTAIPSIAYGVVALLVLAPWLSNGPAGMRSGTNALNASIILAVMALPTIVRVASDALTGVGPRLRQAGYALGATRTQVVWRVVIPAAGSGVIAAVLLGMTRAIGETMVVWMASGGAKGIGSPWWDLGRGVQTLTATIAAEMGQATAGGLHREGLFAIAALLLTATFVLSGISDYCLRRSKRKMKGRT